MKSDMQIVAELLDECKKHLEFEEKLALENELVSRKWMAKLEAGTEDMKLGAEMDSISRELQKEKEEFNLYARLLVKHLIKLDFCRGGKS